MNILKVARCEREEVLELALLDGLDDEALVLRAAEHGATLAALHRPAAATCDAPGERKKKRKSGSMSVL